jgi:hypothetical protein
MLQGCTATLTQNRPRLSTNKTMRNHAIRCLLRLCLNARGLCAGAVFRRGFLLWSADCGAASAIAFSFARAFSSLARAFNSFAYFTRAAGGASSWETVFSSCGLLCLCFFIVSL